MDVLGYVNATSLYFSLYFCLLTATPTQNPSLTEKPFSHRLNCPP